MDNREQFFPRLFTSTLFSLPSPSCYRPTCLRSLISQCYDQQIYRTTIWNVLQTGYFLTPQNWTRWIRMKHKRLDRNVLTEMEVSFTALVTRQHRPAEHIYKLTHFRSCDLKWRTFIGYSTIIWSEMVNLHLSWGLFRVVFNSSQLVRNSNSRKIGKWLWHAPQ